MWRTVFVTKGEQISVRDGSLAVKGEDENLIPVEDIYSVIIESIQTSVTVKAINALTESGAAIVTCDDKHMPCSLTLPLNTHYRSYSVLKAQIEMPEELKAALWKKIIRAKIINQAKVLAFSFRNISVRDKLFEFADEVTDGDVTNREGLAAKMFFRELYGSEFIRMADDAINSALNYGYAILRSAVSKSLVSYGFNCALGIHHIGEFNPYNLSDDLMEPFRPLVDYWTDINHLDLLDSLTLENKRGLINLLNRDVLFDKKKTKVRYAIDLMAKSLASCIEKGGDEYLLLPEIIRIESED